ncbi:MAG TPA: Ig-like domain-containing protein [Solirubrobacteraceae bacterium]|nr:Ig-like domain-containing protein [Solirubrobacteraceae bacterium]
MCRRGLVAVTACATLTLLLAGCGGGAGPGAGASAGGVRLTIAPAGGRTDIRPERGITVTAAGGKIGKVTVRTRGERVSGRLNATRTAWHSTWALNVSRRYTVTATAAGRSGEPVTRTSRFQTLTPARTFSTQIIEGSGQTYGVAMPIILYFSRPIANRAAVERALEVKASRPVVGAWHWDSRCNLAAVCLYFRPRHYWPPSTRVSFTAHLNGVEAARGVYGHHTLTQRFVIGSSLSVVANTADHYMNVYRSGKLFAHWPISTGRPGDETPNGAYLTIEKANPVDMVGPGYNIEVPWSVRFTWSGDYLHDAYWSVAEQGFTNVSHGCVNMSPADAETFYKMAVPGDPVRVTGSPRAGVWDNGWTMWFLSWKRWLRGSALKKAVRAGPEGSAFVSPSSWGRHRRRAPRGARHAHSGAAT